MSILNVKLVKPQIIKNHPNADKLSLAVIDGWQVCIPKNQISINDECVYIQHDSVLPKTLHEFLGVTKYCKQFPKNTVEYQQDKRRVSATNIRGEKSFGILIKKSRVEEFVGQKITQNNVARLLGITKYIPPEDLSIGDIAREHPLFHRYTDIEHWQNFKDFIKNDEMVVITEKIHGTQCRVGLVKDGNIFKIATGSRTKQRKLGKSLYCLPLNYHGVILLLKHLRTRAKQSIIVFGEIYGPKIQDMTYDGKLSFRAFDIAIDGKYLDWEHMQSICKKFDVPTVPVLYVGPFSPSILEKFTDGQTHVCKQDQIQCKFKGREGCVVKTLKEKTINNTRLIFKSVSVDYLNRKNATDN